MIGIHTGHSQWGTTLLLKMKGNKMVIRQEKDKEKTIERKMGNLHATAMRNKLLEKHCIISVESCMV